MNFYNECDPKAAEWLRQLIWVGAIPDGEVDTRSIEDVTPNDLTGFTQCHFFAGIGGWSLALRLAGWPDDQPVWTGSCPCQPFSAAGKSGGFADERHLWPAFEWLIGQCRPPVIFGEQVASPDGLAWLDLVQTDLEGAGYATRAADICAAGVGAPHIRQRLYWLADAGSARQQLNTKRHSESKTGQQTPQRDDTDGCGNALWLADSSSSRGGRDTGAVSGAEGGIERGVRSFADEFVTDGADGGLADAMHAERRPVGLPGQNGRDGPNCGREEAHREPRARSEIRVSDVGNTNNAGSQGWGQRRNGTDKWSTWASSLVSCRDGKWRPVEPGTFPLAHGVSGRVGLLRGYGNAIVPQVTAEFIGAYLDTIR